MHKPLSTRTRSRPPHTFGWPSRAMAVAATALFLTLGGSGYAASVIHSTSAPHHRLRGPRGPRGFAGPAGPRGPAGPAGPAGSGLQAGNIRTVFGAVTTVAPFGSGSSVKDVFATCAAGERIIGGGYLAPGVGRRHGSRVRGGRRRRYTPAREAPSARHAGSVPINGSMSPIARSIIAAAVRRRSGSRSWTAAPPRARRRFPAPRSPGEPSPDQPANDPTHDATSRSPQRPGSGRADRAASPPTPRARPGRAAHATSPDASYTSPRGATTRRSHPASSTDRPPARSTTCTPP